MSDYDISELKDEISIREVLMACGAQFENAWGSDVPFFCPFHLNTDTPAGSMNEAKGLFYCFGCEAKGSIVDAALLHLETDSIREACDWLEEFL